MMKRVEHHRLKPSSPFYAMLREFCHRSKNLYNHGNYLIRQTFIENGKWLRYGEVDRLLKADKDYPDYREMPTAQTAQQTLRLLDKNWTSFFAAIKDWKAHPEKYKGRPNLPKYKPKDGYFPLVLTNQNCKLKDGVIRFPRTFQGFTVKAIFASQPEAVFKQARIIPHGGEIDLELVYELLNADVNGAYQIMRKVFPNVNADGIEGVALRPAVVALSMSARRGSGCA
ncbi:RNA-guided endonuclease InsQ/TnpB family protein [Mitsuokella multacida]|uniref:RNA-guided endonuclease InsQ/TnpB family protein n=1 Tax=Mitsuokella multacida TaxID=52226 RepID=UPI0022E1B180|nr:transposase [Mitsuokella multacida]